MKILFMCTANSCRSVLSEALFNDSAPQGLRAVSAGSFPSGRLNERALRTLSALNVSTQGLCSKGSDAFTETPPDIVITVCDQAAGEPCPVYFGTALKSHWGLMDPSDVSGSEAEIQAAFDGTVAHIKRRLDAFLEKDVRALSNTELKTLLDQIGALA